MLRLATFYWIKLFVLRTLIYNVLWELAGHGPSVQNPNQNPLLISFPKTIFLSLEAEMFKQLHGVFISQEGGSVQWEGSNLENTERLMIIIGQWEASIQVMWSVLTNERPVFMIIAQTSPYRHQSKSCKIDSFHSTEKIQYECNIDMNSPIILQQNAL